MHVGKMILGATLGLTLIGASAGAQAVSWSTSGVFTGCTSTNVIATSALCTVGTTTLRYDFNTGSTVNLTSGFPVASGNFGSFVMLGGSLSGQSFAGVTFSLYLAQTAPTAGNGTVFGTVSGNVIVQGGQLAWTPTAPIFSVGTVNYSLDVDAATQAIRINPPGAAGNPGDVQTIRGTISTVPEPSTYALMTVGLGVLAMAVRSSRRRA